MKKTNQTGFAFIAILLAVVAVGLITFAAVRIKGSGSNVSSSAVLTTRTKVPAKISSPSDLKRASKALDETPVDSGVNPDQLDNDLDSLL